MEERDQLNFTLLADEDHAVADAFGVWGPKKFMGKEYDGIHRQSFLIDEEGKIAHHFDSSRPAITHQVVLDFLRATLLRIDRPATQAFCLPAALPADFSPPTPRPDQKKIHFIYGLT